MGWFTAKNLTVSVSTLIVIASCASTGVRRQRSPAARPKTAVPAASGKMVRVGMSKSDVRRLWGEPRDISSADEASGREIWTYEFKKALSRAVVSRTIYTLTFRGDTLKDVAEITF